MKIEQQIRMFNALKRIAAYAPVENLRRHAEKQYGISPEEAIEYAYENVIQEARNAVRGMRCPKPLTNIKTEG